MAQPKTFKQIRRNRSKLKRHCKVRRAIYKPIENQMKPLTHPSTILQRLCKAEKKFGLVIMVSGWNRKALRTVFPEVKEPWINEMHREKIGYFFFQQKDHLVGFQKKMLDNYRHLKSSMGLQWYSADNLGRSL